MPINYMNMKKLTNILIPVLLFSWETVYTQEFPSIMPSQIKMFLKSNYPDWKLADNMKVLNDPILKELGFDSTKCHPNLVWGDFNGDSKKDYVLLLEKYDDNKNKSQLSIGFIQEKVDYKFYVIGQADYPAYLAEYIWISFKGTKLYNFETDKYFVSKKDGIDFIVSEKSGETYFFEKNKFISITTAD